MELITELYNLTSKALIIVLMPVLSMMLLFIAGGYVLTVWNIFKFLLNF